MAPPTQERGLDRQGGSDTAPCPTTHDPFESAPPPRRNRPLRQHQQSHCFTQRAMRSLGVTCERRDGNGHTTVGRGDISPLMWPFEPTGMEVAAAAPVAFPSPPRLPPPPCRLPHCPFRFFSHRQPPATLMFITIVFPSDLPAAPAVWKLPIARVTVEWRAGGGTHHPCSNEVVESSRMDCKEDMKLRRDLVALGLT